MNKSVYKTITELAGALFIFAAGLLFVIVTDVKLKLTAGWLFICILLSFAGGICSLLAASKKDKIPFFFTLKGVGLGVSAGYLVYLFIYKASDVFPKSQALGPTGRFVFVFSLILTIVGLVCQAANIVLNILNQDDLGDIGPVQEEK